MIGPCGGSHAAAVPKLVIVCADQVLPCWGASVVPHLMVREIILQAFCLHLLGGVQMYHVVQWRTRVLSWSCDSGNVLPPSVVTSKAGYFDV